MSIMASMNPLLRIRQTYRSCGISSEGPDEALAAHEDQYPHRRESEERLARMFAKHRRQFLIEMIVVFSIAVGIIAAVN